MTADRPDQQSEAELKLAKKQVKQAGDALRRAEQQHSRAVRDAERSLDHAQQPLKLYSLAQGKVTLFDDRVDIRGGTSIGLVAGASTAEFITVGDAKSPTVHLTVSGPDGYGTVQLPGSLGGQTQEFVAALRLATTRAEQVARERQQRVSQLETALTQAEAETGEVDRARHHLQQEEARTGLTYSPSHRTRNVLLTTAAVFVLIMAIGALTDSPTPTESVASGSTAASARRPVATSAATTTSPSSMHTRKSATPKPTKTAKPKPTRRAKPKPPEYAAIGHRQWLRIVRNPDGHFADRVVVYGVVTQADAATGSDSLRADVDGVRHYASYGYFDYPTNTVLTSGNANASRLLEGDVFRAEVTVMGSVDYETTLGGELSVPMLELDRIQRIGHQS